VARLLLIGVDFDSCAREGAVAEAATELRRLGLVDRLAFRHDVVDWGELITAAPAAERGTATTLLNEEALLLLVRRLRDAVGYGLGEDATPVVYGADCAVLLGALAGAREENATLAERARQQESRVEVLAAGLEAERQARRAAEGSAADLKAENARLQERTGHVDELRTHIKALQGSAAPPVNQNQPKAPAKASRTRKKGGQGAE